jgi:chemotaxis protein histidine kinase CheA
LLQAHETLTESKLETLLFSPGFSTKSEASIISGRGVGLDAVRSALESEKGRIHLRLTEKDEDKGTWHFHFEMTLPASTFITGPKSEQRIPQAS